MVKISSSGPAYSEWASITNWQWQIQDFSSIGQERKIFQFITFFPDYETVGQSPSRRYLFGIAPSSVSSLDIQKTCMLLAFDLGQSLATDAIISCENVFFLLWVSETSLSNYLDAWIGGSEAARLPTHASFSIHMKLPYLIFLERYLYCCGCM